MASFSFLSLKSRKCHVLVRLVLIVFMPIHNILKQNTIKKFLWLSFSSIIMILCMDKTYRPERDLRYFQLYFNSSVSIFSRFQSSSPAKREKKKMDSNQEIIQTQFFLTQIQFQFIQINIPKHKSFKISNKFFVLTTKSEHKSSKLH